MKKVFSFLMILSLALSMVSVIAPKTLADPAHSDEFEGATLVSEWTWVDPHGDCSYSLTGNPGYLRIYAPHGDHDLYTYSNLNAPRLIQSARGDFTIETKLLFDPRYDVQGAGILIWKDSDNYLRLDRLLHRGGEQVVDLSGEDKGLWSYLAETPYNYTISYLRLERMGDMFTASYSKDGVSWMSLYRTSFPLGDPVSIGIFVLNQWQNISVYAEFDYFRVKVIQPQPVLVPSGFIMLAGTIVIAIVVAAGFIMVESKKQAKSTKTLEKMSVYRLNWL